MTNPHKCFFDIFHFIMYISDDLLCPRPVGGGIKRWSASVVCLSVCLSVCLMSRTSALTRKPKGLGRRNFAQGYPRSHATPTPTSRSKGQKSRRGGGILWRPPSRTACCYCFPWISLTNKQKYTTESNSSSAVSTGYCRRPLAAVN